MKSVVFLTHVGDPGGAEYKMIELCRAMSDTSEIVHFRSGKLNQILEDRGVAHSELPMPAIIDKYKRQAGLGDFLKAVPAVISMIRRVGNKCSEFDCVVCMSQKSFIIASLAKPLMRKKIIWFMNDIVSTEHFGRISLLIANIFSRIFANHVVLNSQASYDAWIEAGFKKKNVSIIYSGINVDEIDRQISEVQAVQSIRNQLARTGESLVGLFARITPWKGQDIFLRALCSLPNVRGVIVGEANFGEEAYKESLRELSRNLGLDARVTFVGHSEKVAQYMAACDIIAHCSTSPEPFGRVIVEAMMVGKPVIAANEGGAKEIVISEESGLLTPAGDPVALQQAIQRLIESPEWAMSLASKGQIRAKERFSTNIMLEEFRNLL